MNEQGKTIWQQLTSWQSRRIGLIMLLFFLTMAVFWILKPIRKSLFIGHFKDNPFELFNTSLGGAQTEQLAKLSMVVVAFFVALILPFLIKRCSMRQLLVMVSTIAMIGLGASYFLIGNPTAPFVWSFYVFGDFINSLIITLLWMFLHNSVSTEQAKKIYSAVGIGTVAGGMFGAFLVFYSINSLGRETIIAISIAMIGAVAGLGYYMACRIADSKENMKNCIVAYQQHRLDSNKKENPFSFWKNGSEFPKTSKYWLAIALLVGIYEVSSGIIDFQLSVAVENVQASAYERDMYFGIIGQAQSFVALLVQVFVTGWVIKRWGVGIALLILPFATLFGSVGFLLIPTLASAMFLSVSDNALNYSVNQSAKETLYVPTNPEERVAAKSVIDLFVQRFAKAFAVILNLILVTQVSLQNVRWLSVLAIGLMIFWIFIARFTSREFEHLAVEESKFV